MADIYLPSILILCCGYIIIDIKERMQYYINILFIVELYEYKYLGGIYENINKRKVCA